MRILHLILDDDSEAITVAKATTFSNNISLTSGDGALQFTNAGKNSIKIPDNHFFSGLVIEEGNNDTLHLILQMIVKL